LTGGRRLSLHLWLLVGLPNIEDSLRFIGDRLDVACDPCTSQRPPQHARPFAR
jgi:hypothetical protein